jgi:KaiC/GvpD/RAD55 family RecA-like ATPase
MTAPIQRPLRGAAPDMLRLHRATRLEDESRGQRDEATDPTSIACDQVTDAMIAIDRPVSSYLRMPWPTLDALVDGIAPGDVWYVAAFSGQGKTTFLTSALDQWFELGQRVYMLGLESRPFVLRTHWACKRLDLDAGDLLTGAVHGWSNGAAVRERVKAEIKSQATDKAKVDRVFFAPAKFLDLRALERAAGEAADFGADVVIVDHVDHIRAGDGKNGFSESQAVQHSILELAQRYNQRYLVATQLNNDAVRGDRLGMYQPPQAGSVFMGGVKRQVASGMLGLYRPLRGMQPGESPKEYHAALTRVRQGEAEPQTVVTPNQMAVVVMKHRVRGSHEGRRCALGVERGRVVELSPRDRWAAP